MTLRMSRYVCGLVVGLLLAGASAVRADDPEGGQSNCCFANGGPGCDDPVCASTVCALDPFCCNVAWDGICANEALELCPNTCGGDPSNCCLAHGGLGCDDPDCQAAVCAVDPFCCQVAWDQICADEAHQFCGGLCGSNNDDCFNALPIGDGVTPFSTIGATTDGPPHPTLCNFFGDPQISQDIWFDYVATSSQNVTVSLCGSDYDTELAVYLDCFCPVSDGNLLACNDDFCGLQSEVTFAAVAGQCYKIRVGGFGGATGSGTINIVGGGCPASTNDCCVAGVGPGCIDTACFTSVCALDPFCCDAAWDPFCADLAGQDPNCPCMLDCADVCPAGAMIEVQPPNGPCAAGQDDTVNGGCNVEPNVFAPINCGDTVCGISGNDLNMQGIRDLDWYSLPLAQPTALHWSAACEFASRLFIADISVCPSTILVTQEFAACAPASISACLPPGNYALIVTTSDFFGQHCPRDYVATVSCAPIGAALPNDDCFNASVITNGDTFFSTCDATTDGPPSCGAIGNDIWFDYLASCTGNVTISLCDATGYDSVLAVYDGCTCPVSLGNELACDDDFCTVAGGSQVTFAAVQGQCYKVRVGGFNGATGAGVIHIECAPAGGEPDCVQWNRMAGNWSDPANWSGGVVPDNNGMVPGFCVQIAGVASVVTQDIASGVEVDFLLLEDSTLNITGGDLTIESTSGFINNGHPTVGNARAFRGEADFTIDGMGPLRLDGLTASFLSAPGDTITNAGTHTISGRGIINADIVNQGTIRGDVEAQTLLVCGPSTVNDGLIAATDGGIVRIDDSISGTGDYLIQGGTMQIVSDAEGPPTMVFGDCIDEPPGILLSVLDIIGPGTSVTANAMSVSGGTANIIQAALTVVGPLTICPATMADTAAVHLTDSTLSTGSLTICDGGVLTVASGVAVQSSFTLESTDEADWSWAPDATLTMNATAGIGQLEIGGRDLGTQPANHVGDPAGFVNNFDLSILVIGPGAQVTLVDAVNNGNRNGPGGSAEALYVDVLQFANASGQLNLNGLHLYYNQLVTPPGGGFTQIVNNPPGASSVSIVSANPPHASANGGVPFMDVLQNRTATQAQQPQGIGVTNTPPAGPITYDAICLTFSGTPVPTPALDNVFVACTDAFPPSGDCPTVQSVSAGAPCPGGSHAIRLTGPPPPRECITLTFSGTSAGQKLQYRVLPGNADLNGASNTQDLLDLVRALNNGSATVAANAFRYDMNRSGAVNTQDLLRIVQLLNGALTTQPFNLASVATCP